MNCSLDVITTATNWIKNILKIVPKLVLAKVTKAHPYLVINLIPLRLWQMKIEFEDGLINFKLLFLKLEKVSEFLIFMSNLFHSMAVDEKQECQKNHGYHRIGECC